MNNALLEVINAENKYGYIDANNVVMLNAEFVARGLGFAESKNGVEYVRWCTIKGYLRSFGFSQEVGKGDFIPENMFFLSDEHLTSKLIAKEYGHSAHWLHQTLIKLNFIYKRGRHYYLKAKYADKNYRVSETVILEGGKTVVSHFWTQSGRNAIYWLLKKNNIVSLRERQALMAELL